MRSIFIGWVILGGCVAADPGGPSSASSAPLVDLASLELQRTPLQARLAEGSDEAPLSEVRWAPGGAVFPEPALTAAAWKDAAAVVDARGRLHRFGRDGRTTFLADDVAGMVVSADGELLAYTRGDWYGPRDVHLVHEGRDERLAAQVRGASVIAVDARAGAMFLIASSPGGVAGLHVIDLEATPRAPRCLTNCALRTGTPWGDAFVPPPESWSDVTLDLGELRYRDELDREISITWREVAR